MSELLENQRVISPRLNGDFNGSLNESLNERQKKNHGKVIRLCISILIGGLILLLIGQLMFYFFIAPHITLRNITLTTDMDLTIADITERGGIHIGELFHLVREQDIYKNLIDNPDIKAASVRRIFPDTLNITVYGREPLCILMVAYGDVRFPVLIDDEGVIYRIGYEIDDWNLPIVQGISFDAPELGAQVRRSYAPMLEDIRSLSSDDLLRAFSEFYIDEVYEGVYEWVLIPIHIPVRVRAAAGLDRAQGLYILKILEVLQEQGMEDITEIDFRTGDVVYNRGGGNGPR
ncbi:MAG: cell division protein FtsQ/DivIB [Salinispira sp.]